LFATIVAIVAASGKQECSLHIRCPGLTLEENGPPVAGSEMDAGPANAQELSVEESLSSGSRKRLESTGAI